MKIIARSLIVLFALFVLTCSASASDWQMFHHDSSHSGYTPDQGPATNESLWVYEAGDSVTSSPAIVNGMIYFGSYDDYVYALDAGTGEEKWKYRTGANVYSSPAVLNNVVYIGSEDSYVYALDAGTGEEKWKYKTGGKVYSSPELSFVFVIFG